MIYELEDTGIGYREDDLLYPVREDSILLLRATTEILKKSEGRFMEMGCGNGIVSLTASYYKWETYCVDREPRALGNLRGNLKMNGLEGHLLLSDLFEGIPRGLKSSFTLMVFNPPYLPENDYTLDRRDDFPLVGGEKGYEISINFLKGARNYLMEGGDLILIAVDERDWISGIRGIDLEGLRYDGILSSGDAGDHKLLALRFRKNHR